MRRTKEEAEETRQQLLDAALQVFSAKGYVAARLEEIAQAAGVTRGAIYWHFKDKPGLYAALLESVAAASQRIQGEAAAEGGTYLEVMERILVRLLSVIEEDPQVRAIFELQLFKTGAALELAAVLDDQRAAGRSMVDAITAIMAQAQAAGEVRIDLSPREAALAFLAYQNGLALMWLQDPNLFSLRTEAPVFAAMYVRSISAT